MQIVKILVPLAAGVLLVMLVTRVTPRKSKLEVTGSQAYFPVVSGYNLERQEYVFPRDFEGEVNLVIVPFQRYQQALVDTWIPVAQQIEADFPNFVYYELPTLTTMSSLSRTFLNEGMRAGIPDATARQRTITLYLDKEVFKDALEIPSEDDIYLFLVSRSGEILWRAEGEYTPEKSGDLIELLEERQ